MDGLARIVEAFVCLIALIILTPLGWIGMLCLAMLLKGA